MSSPLLIPPVAVAAGEGKPNRLQQRTCVVVGLGGRRDRDVETTDLLDVVVVDLREDDLLPDAHRVIAAPVEGVRVQAAEVTDARERDRDEAVEELVHAG